MRLFTVIWLCLSLVMPRTAQGQTADAPITRILFLLDASQSMGAGWGGRSKIEVAKQVISDAVDSLSGIANVQVALRAYGHQYHYTLNNCKDSRLEVGFRPNSHILVKSKLREIKPNGITPIAYSLEKVAGDFPLDPNSRNIVIIITDGEESCEGNPCQVSAALQSRNVILRPFVIGLGYQSELKTNLDCIGTYFEANSPNELKETMQGIIHSLLDQTTVEVHLNDLEGNPTETDVALSFFNPLSGLAQYNFYHTLTARGTPDTMEVDPINAYYLIVHTLPPIIKRNVRLEPNTHNIIDITSPQGDLQVLMRNSNERYNANIQVVVKQADRTRTVNVQRMNTRERYLIGNYDLIIMTLPRITVSNIELKQREVTTIEIPEPGILTINSRVELYGGIFRMVDNRMEKIYQLNDRILKESILLQPGTYWVVTRHKVNRSAEETITRKITIRSGESTTINL